MNLHYGMHGLRWHVVCKWVQHSYMDKVLTGTRSLKLDFSYTFNECGQKPYCVG